MKKLRIRLAAVLLASMLILTGCSENERIPVPDLPDLPDLPELPIISDAPSETVSPAASVFSENTYVSEPVGSSDGSSSARHESSEPIAAGSSEASAGTRSTASVSAPSESSTTASSTPVSMPSANSAPVSSTPVSIPPESSTPKSSIPVSTAHSSETPIEAPGCDEGVHNLVTDNGVVPTCKLAGLSCGVHCEACGEVISRQDKLSRVHDFRVTDIARPANGEDGTVSYACTGCGYPFECAYRASLTERSVYSSLLSMKTVYPEGTPFDNDVKYVTRDLIPNVEFTGRGCAGFAAKLSDGAFGDLPGRYHFDFTKIKIGDIVRTQNNSHSVIVLKVEGSVITVAEGNYNGAVHWGRTLDLSDASVGWTYVLTRYPE